MRVSLLADKVAVGHKGSKPHWSKTIYEVKRIMKFKRGKDRYVIHTDDGDRHGTYFRDKLLAVSIPKYGMQEDEKELEASSGDEYEPVEVEESEDEAPAPQWAEAREQKEELDEKRAEPPKKKPQPAPPPPKKKPQPAPPAKKKPQPAPPKNHSQLRLRRNRNQLLLRLRRNRNQLLLLLRRDHSDEYEQSNPSN